MNILMIYPEFPDTFWSFKHALSFVKKRASSPPLGLVTVAAMLPKEWDKRLVDVNIRSLSDKDIAWADFVLISAMVVQRKSTIDIIKRCKTQGKRIIAGGPLFTSESENFADVDYMILNEAELTLPPFLKDLEEGNPQHIYSTSEFPEMSQTPIPMWELVDRDAYDSMSIQYSRGCPFDCEFCNITALLGHRPRTKSAKQIIAELDRLYDLGWRRNIFFVDDNFIGNKRQIKTEILPALIEWRKDKKGCLFITEASINLADDPELMQMMVAAGFVSVFVGIETPDDMSLTECHKLQNRNRNLVDSVKKMQRAGIQVMGGFIVGFDSDTPSIFKRQIDFIQQSGIVTAMVGLLQAPSGTRLYERLRGEGRILTEMSGDNADGTTNIIPRMDPDMLQSGYQEVLDEIYSPKLFTERVKNFLEDYQPVNRTVTIEKQEVLALFRSILQIGILGESPRYYWNLFFWSLVHFPEKFPLAITLSIYGFHFRKVKNANAGI